MRKIDAHMHVNFRGIDSSSIIKHLDKAAVDKCWLHTWEEKDPAIPSLYKGFPPEDIFAVFDRHPERIVPFYAPDPASPDIKNKLISHISKGLKGCGELKVSLKWDDGIITEYLDIINELKLPLMFHMEEPKVYYIPERDSFTDRAFAVLINGAFNGVTGYYIRKLAESLKPADNFLKKKSVFFPGYLYNFIQLENRLAEYPGITFIGHGPGFWNNLSDRQSGKYFYQKGKYSAFGITDRLLENYPNLYCDISGRGAFIALMRDKRQTALFLQKHYDKILFGTDNTDSVRLENIILSAGLSKSGIEAIFSSNARAIAG